MFTLKQLPCWVLMVLPTRWSCVCVFVIEFLQRYECGNYAWSLLIIMCVYCYWYCGKEVSLCYWFYRSEYCFCFSGDDIVVSIVCFTQRWALFWYFYCNLSQPFQCFRVCLFVSCCYPVYTITLCTLFVPMCSVWFAESHIVLVILFLLIVLFIHLYLI